MRILLCDRLTSSGAAAGGLVAAIENRLKAAGHEVEQVLLPYFDERSAAPSQLMAYRLLGLRAYCDHIVALGAPSHVVDHPSKVIWCCNEPASLLPDPDGGLPDWLAASDRLGFGEALAVHVSTEARLRQLRAAGIAAELMPIPGDVASSAQMDAVIERLLTPQSRTLDAVS